ncbi:MAG: Flp pilus assembly protein CpaB [Rhodospirillales bacterium]|nr:Flp pilus assembly protein CpaB [Rhodospirillales bacterium]
MALVAAGGTVYLVRQFLATQEQEVEKVIAESKSSQVEVLVADRDIAAGTVITSSIIRWQQWPESGVIESYISARKGSSTLEDQVIGSVVISGLAAGEPITPKRLFKRGTAGFLSGVLPKGKRAFPISVNLITGGAGFVRPGDRVDVILLLDMRNQMNIASSVSRELINGEILRYTAETIMENVNVLAIDQSISDQKEKAGVAKTITLEVTPREVQLLSIARQMGTLSLSLRSLALEPVSSQAAVPYSSDMEVSPALMGLYGFSGGAQRRAPQSTTTESKQEKSVPVTRSSNRSITVYRGANPSTVEMGQR